MEVKLIRNEDFMQLAELCCEMYKAIDPSINEFQAVNTLINQINTEKAFLAVGLYDGTALAGLVLGHEYNEKTFYFSGIYVIIKNNASTKQLIEFSFDHIKKLGYTAWEVDATSDNVASIMEKYGAKAKYTRYRKEEDGQANR